MGQGDGESYTQGKEGKGQKLPEFLSGAMFSDGGDFAHNPPTPPPGHLGPGHISIVLGRGCYSTSCAEAGLGQSFAQGPAPTAKTSSDQHARGARSDLLDFQTNRGDRQECRPRTWGSGVRASAPAPSQEKRLPSRPFFMDPLLPPAGKDRLHSVPNTL